MKMTTLFHRDFTSILLFPYSFLLDGNKYDQMNNPNLNENPNQSGSRVVIFLYRSPKKNHDVLVKVNKHSHDFFYETRRIKI